MSGGRWIRVVLVADSWSGEMNGETVGEQTDEVTFVMLFLLGGWWGAFGRKVRYANMMQLCGNCTHAMQTVKSKRQHFNPIKVHFDWSIASATTFIGIK